MSSSRRGAITGATWLIGLGIVFLVREIQGWTWGEAWPLFVILVGVATFISTLMNWRPGFAGIWSFTWPVAWIAGGIVLLMSTTGQLAQGPGETISEYWPWVAIVIGVWFLIGAFVPVGKGPTEQLSIPLEDVADAGVQLRFGAGVLTARPAAPGMLVDGTFVGGVRQKRNGPNRLELDQDTTYGLPWIDHDARWDVGLTAEVPLDLRLDTGANRSTLDLRDLRLRNLELHTGASETRVLLPRAAGATAVRAEARRRVADHRGAARVSPRGSGAGWRSAAARSTRLGSRRSARATNRRTTRRRPTASTSISRAASGPSRSSAGPPDACSAVRVPRAGPSVALSVVRHPLATVGGRCVPCATNSTPSRSCRGAARDPRDS